MKSVYLNREQCKYFDLDYDGAAHLHVSAATLLASNSQGYDAKHTTFLKKHNDNMLLLKRTNEAAPGWFIVANIL